MFLFNCRESFNCLLMSMALTQAKPYFLQLQRSSTSIS